MKFKPKIGLRFLISEDKNWYSNGQWLLNAKAITMLPSSVQKTIRGEIAQELKNVDIERLLKDVSKELTEELSGHITKDAVFDEGRGSFYVKVMSGDKEAYVTHDYLALLSMFSFIVKDKTGPIALYLGRELCGLLMPCSMERI